MKLIIDINDNEYEGIKGYPDNITSYPVTIHLYDAVRNGVSLDDLKKEIDKESVMHMDGEIYIRNINVKRILDKDRNEVNL